MGYHFQFVIGTRLWDQRESQLSLYLSVKYLCTVYNSTTAPRNSKNLENNKTLCTVYCLRNLICCKFVNSLIIHVFMHSLIWLISKPSRKQKWQRTSYFIQGMQVYSSGRDSIVGDVLTLVHLQGFVEIYVDLGMMQGFKLILTNLLISHYPGIYAKSKVSHLYDFFSMRKLMLLHFIQSKL